MPFLPAPYDTGPRLGYGAGQVFYFPADCLDGPVFSSLTLAPVRGPTYSYE